MTDKELLYVQDAELRSFAQQLEQQHKNVFQNLYNLL